MKRRNRFQPPTFHIFATRTTGEKRGFHTLAEAETWLDEELKLGDPPAYIGTQRKISAQTERPDMHAPKKSRELSQTKKTTTASSNKHRRRHIKARGERLGLPGVDGPLAG